MHDRNTLKVYSGRAPRLKKVIWNSQILADFSNRSTVKSIKKIVWDFEKSGNLYVWEFDMNRPWFAFFLRRQGEPGTSQYICCIYALYTSICCGSCNWGLIAIRFHKMHTCISRQQKNFHRNFLDILPFNFRTRFRRRSVTHFTLFHGWVYWRVLSLY